MRQLAVLAVDDHEINRSFIRAALGGRVGRLEVAASGREAIRRCASAHFDIVLMDVHMPDMDGHEAWQAIRDGDSGARPSGVIALTADGRPEQTLRLRASGFRGVLSKPVSADTLLDAVARVASGSGSFVDSRETPPASPMLLDDDRAQRALGGSADLASLRRQLLSELAGEADRLDRLLALGSRDEAVARLHRCRGACGYVGAARLESACQRLEDALRNEGDAFAAGPYTDWLRAVEASRAALRLATSDRPFSHRSPPAGASSRARPRPVP